MAARTAESVTPVVPSSSWGLLTYCYLMLLFFVVVHYCSFSSSWALLLRVCGFMGEDPWMCAHAHPREKTGESLTPRQQGRHQHRHRDGHCAAILPLGMAQRGGGKGRQRIGQQAKQTCNRNSASAANQPVTITRHWSGCAFLPGN